MSTMKQAQVTAFGQPPAIQDVPLPVAPAEDEVQLRVLTAGIHQLVRSRAAGQHYSAKGLPHVPGIDGIGEDSTTGTKHYFSNIGPTAGTMQEVINVKKAATAVLPESIKTTEQAVQIAGLMNPLMASWMAFDQRIDRALLPKQGFTVLVLGATGVSGKVAIPTSRHFGATKVIGVARSASKMAGLGLDATFELAAPAAAETDFSTLLADHGPIDVVLDFLYGDPALAFFTTYKGPASKPLQYVQIGSSAGLEISLPSAVLRSKNLTLRGTGPGSWTLDQYAAQTGDMAAFLASGKVAKQEFAEIGIDEVETKWGDGKGERMVVVL